MQMNLIDVFILTAVLVEISLATEIFYVLPDNSPNISCPSLHCATISQYFLDNGTIPVVSNVEYRLLPGEHYIITTEITELANFQNFSMIGVYNDQPQLPSTILFRKDIAILESFNVTITNVVFETLLQHNSNLWLILCISCTIENVTLIGCGLSGHNLIGRSYLNNLVINLAKSSTTEQYCYNYQGITLQYNGYFSFKENKSEMAYEKCLIIVQKISISRDKNKCYTYKGIINVEAYLPEYSVEIIISDSQFDHMVQTIIYFKHEDDAHRCIMWIKNCRFGSNFVGDASMITADVPQFNTALNFLNCEFYYNEYKDFLVSVTSLDTEVVDMNVVGTNITFNMCKFINNRGELLSFIITDLPNCKVNILFIGPVYINGNTAIDEQKLISIGNTVLHIYGPVMISNNTAYNNIMVFELCNISIKGPITISNNMAFNKNIMFLESCSILFQGPVTISHHFNTNSILLFMTCEIIFDKKITFISNYCNNIITIKSEYTYIKVLQHAKIAFLDNAYYGDLINFESNNDHNQPYPFCLFQYITTNNTTTDALTLTLKSYSIIFTGNALIHFHARSKCIPTFLDRFTSHCKWLPTSVFFGHNSGLINQQVIKVDYKKINHHTFICLNSKFHYDCSIDTLGPVYPGQTLQVELVSPCGIDTSVIYAETHNNLLPSTACKIAHQTELLNSINNNSGIINYTIVSDSTDICELFLTISPHLYYVYEAFYVKLLPCPVGFTLQNGRCDCDSLLPPDIDTCYIEQSAIRRPVAMWISAHIQSNDTKYLTSNCPMDYCLPYSSNVILTNPDTQCQFNRTGILCSQCQHPLSMVFGSSRCMKCANLHVLISILIILAGGVLVTFSFLLNLTVTNGTISGIIFYANIISINDSVFLINDNVHESLRIFISFANLDLGIQTCFYNGMNSYAKIWLQLFFPSYLIIFAVAIIIASRYSHRILRLTYTRSLPVLATLFLLSYNGVLRVVLTVLFSYSTITHLPNGHQQIVWSIDASVPLFGLKFTMLFITCLVLFLLLIPFNIILLFTRYLSQFRMINRFKPLLDAFQGSYKDKYYYWVGVHVTLRSIFYALYAFQLHLRLIFAAILLILFICYFGYIQPYKNKTVNIQELLLLANLTILHAASYHNNNRVFSIISNFMIGLAFIQFCTIMLCHFLIYTCHCNVVTILAKVKEKLTKLYSLRKPNNHQHIEISLLNIPECTYNYSEYQDGLISNDFS